MSTIYLPTLRKLKIKNFSLYPNGLNFEYDFINGINLIIGGNGMGKTTFVNIIKYGIIGNYTREFDYKRTYKEKKIEGRKSFPNDYFKNRLDNTVLTSSLPTTTIEFSINKNIFIIERSLDELTINSVILNGTKLKGEIINQKKYDNLNDEYKPQYLPYIYEEKIATLAGMPFDDLIFFVNEVLFFGENHQTVLWNDSEPNVQNELFNKYFNSPELNLQRQEAERLSRYYNSLSRHKSEDIRAIQNVLKKVAKTEDENTLQSLNTKILELKNSIKRIDANIEKKQTDRISIDNKISLLNNRINKLSLKESELDKEKKVIEEKLFEKKWIKLNKKYEDYLQNLKINKLCPMCNNEVEDSFVLEKINHSNNCFLCNQEINETTHEELNSIFKEKDIQIKKIYNEIQNIIKDTHVYENSLKELDRDFKLLEIDKRKSMSTLRALEYENIKESDKNPNELQAFYDEILELEKLKEEYQEKSKAEKIKSDIFSQKIEESISKNTNRFSNLFSQFAGSFLGVNCSLSFTDLGDGNKRFYPIIDGKIRYYEDELSESQRFFIDHSFRMSILTFFYTKPTFYIVETPDSSLDISYERNAAEVFAKFLEKPNSIIITSNLNNSDFVNHLIEITNVSVISLLEIGKKSVIQNSSSSLKRIYDKIKLKVQTKQ